MPVAVADIPPVRIRLFGNLSVTVAGQPEISQFPTQKIALALGYLALHRGEAQSREALGELLWPESDPAAQRVRLNTVVYNVRRILEPTPIVAGSVLLTGRNQITLLREGAHVDVREFESLVVAARQAQPDDGVGRAERLEQAVALYQGKLLPSFYEEEIVREQERLELLCFNALLDLANAWNATGAEAATKAIDAARRAVLLDPLSEAANMALIQSQARAGLLAAALQSYRRMEALFRQEMGAAPPAALRDFVETLRPMAAPAPESLIPNNVPSAVTSFIGRGREAAEIMRLLRETRLLTLSGTGGVGKTRLSLKIASDILEQSPEQFPDGVWLVELAPLSDSALVGRTVAATLGIREQPGQLIVSTLTDHLKNKHLLLVLDNCEHVIQASADLASALLRLCPRVTLLATSREPLGIHGETTFRVPSLSLPDPTREYAAESLSQYESVRLFIARAVSVKSGFRVTNRNAPALAQLCFRLDGIPLAIELAAARLRSLTVEQINERLDSRFQLLTGGDRSALPRQQTLRALIDWSFDLLSESEKILLTRLSTFVGGWTLEAAERICAFGPIDLRDVLNLLTSLADKSLVLAEQAAVDVAEATVSQTDSIDVTADDSAARYRLLETIRQYSVEKQASPREASDLQIRHIGFFVELAEAIQPELTGPDQEAFLNRLESEHDNLRSALDECTRRATTGNAEIALAGLRLAGSLWRFWMVRGYASEGRERLTRAVSGWRSPGLIAAGASFGGDDAETRAVATALRATGRLAWGQGDFAAAETFLSEALDLHRAVADTSGVAGTLSSLGLVADKQGRPAAARELLMESLGLNRELGDRGGIASVLSNLGLLAYNQGEYEVARSQFEESLALDRDIGDKGGIANTLSNLGNVVFDQGDFVAAQAMYQDSLTLSRELGDKNGIANTLGNLANILIHQGDLAAARMQYEEGLVLQREIGDKIGIAITLGNLGNLAKQQGDHAAARSLHKESLRLYAAAGDKLGIAYGLEGIANAEAEDLRFVVSLCAAAEALRANIGAPLPPSSQESLKEQMAARRDSLGEAAYAEAWDQGLSLTSEQAIEMALAE